MDMYRALARSRITLNRHIDVAENNANNMRLYEATGVGSLLITDRKDNLGEIFEVGKEIVAYSSQEEAAELIRYYLDHAEEAATIARAGQARTLREHTYRHRMEELVPILQRYLQGSAA
jgi:spore maturation protein CgeB